MIFLEPNQIGIKKAKAQKILENEAIFKEDKHQVSTRNLRVLKQVRSQSLAKSMCSKTTD